MIARQAHETTSTPVPNPDLVLDLLEWLAHGRRRYAETMSMWRTSCPRLSIWEDAIAMGLVGCVRERGTVEELVILTPEGRRLLAEGRSGG